MTDGSVEVDLVLGEHLSTKLGQADGGLPRVAQDVSDRLHEAMGRMGPPAGRIVTTVHEEVDLDPYDFVFRVGPAQVGRVRDDALRSGPEVAEAAARLLVANRDLLITEGVSEALSAGWVGILGTDESFWRSALRLAAEAGLELEGFVRSLGRELAAAEEGTSPEACAEDVLAKLHRGVVVSVPEGVAQDLDALDLEVQDGFFTRTGVPGSWIRLERADSVEPSVEIRLNNLVLPPTPVGTFSPATSIVDALVTLAPCLLTQQTLAVMLGRLQKGFPMVVFSAVDALGTFRLLSVLRSLLKEGVGVRNLRAVLDAALEVRESSVGEPDTELLMPPGVGVAVAASGPTGASPPAVLLGEYIRGQLGEQLRRSVDGAAFGPWSHLPEELEARLDELRADMTDVGRSTTQKAFALWLSSSPGAVVTSEANRPLASELIRREFPGRVVLSRSELRRVLR